MEHGSLLAINVAKAAGVTAKNISDWVTMGIIRPAQRNHGRGRPHLFSEQHVIQARVVSRASKLGFVISNLSPFLEMIPIEPLPGSCLCIRSSKDGEMYDAAVMQWNEIDPSEGEALIIIQLR